MISEILSLEMSIHIPVTGFSLSINIDASMVELTGMMKDLGTKFKTSTWGLLAFILLKMIKEKKHREPKIKEIEQTPIIEIKDLHKTFGKDNKNTALYKDGKLLNRDGSQYTGDGVKVRKDGSIKITDSFLPDAPEPSP